MMLARRLDEIGISSESGEPMVVENVATRDKVAVDLLDDWIVRGEGGRHAGN